MSLTVLHTPVARAMSPCGAVLGHPVVAHTCCSWWALSIHLSLGCLPAPFGQRGSRRDPHRVQVSPCFICS